MIKGQCCVLFLLVIIVVLSRLDLQLFRADRCSEIGRRNPLLFDLLQHKISLGVSMLTCEATERKKHTTKKMCTHRFVVSEQKVTVQCAKSTQDLCRHCSCCASPERSEVQYIVLSKAKWGPAGTNAKRQSQKLLVQEPRRRHARQKRTKTKP